MATAEATVVPVGEDAYKGVGYCIPDQADGDDNAGDRAVKAQHLGIEQQHEHQVGRFLDGINGTAGAV